MFDRTLAYYSIILYKEFMSYTATKLKGIGLNYGVLFLVLYVGKYPGCKPSELTDALHLDWGHSQRSISRLVQDGFMTKSKSENDGRVYQLHLTEKGEEAFQICHRVFFDWDNEVLSVLSADERTTLFHLLEKMEGKHQSIHCIFDRRS